MQRSILNILVFSTLDQLYISLRWLVMKEKSLTKLLLFLDFGPNSSRETTCVFKFPMNVFNVQCNLKWQPGKVWPFWEKMKSTLDHLIPPQKTDFYHCDSFEDFGNWNISWSKKSYFARLIFSMNQLTGFEVYI